MNIEHTGSVKEYAELSLQKLSKPILAGLRILFFGQAWFYLVYLDMNLKLMRIKLVWIKVNTAVSLYSNNKANVLYKSWKVYKCSNRKTVKLSF